MQPLLNISDFYENLIGKFIFTQDNQTTSEIDTKNYTNIYVRLIMIYLIIIGLILMLLIRLKNWCSYINRRLKC